MGCFRRQSHCAELRLQALLPWRLRMVLVMFAVLPVRIIGPQLLPREIYEDVTADFIDIIHGGFFLPPTAPRKIQRPALRLLSLRAIGFLPNLYSSGQMGHSTNPSPSSIWAARPQSCPYRCSKS